MKGFQKLMETAYYEKLRMDFRTGPSWGHTKREGISLKTSTCESHTNSANVEARTNTTLR